MSKPPVVTSEASGQGSPEASSPEPLTLGVVSWRPIASDQSAGAEADTGADADQRPIVRDASGLPALQDDVADGRRIRVQKTASDRRPVLIAGIVLLLVVIGGVTAAVQAASQRQLETSTAEFLAGESDLTLALESTQAVLADTQTILDADPTGRFDEESARVGLSDQIVAAQDVVSRLSEVGTAPFGSASAAKKAASAVRLGPLELAQEDETLIASGDALEAARRTKITAETTRAETAFGEARLALESSIAGANQVLLDNATLLVDEPSLVALAASVTAAQAVLDGLLVPGALPPMPPVGVDAEAVTAAGEWIDATDLVTKDLGTHLKAVTDGVTAVNERSEVLTQEAAAAALAAQRAAAAEALAAQRRADEAREAGQAPVQPQQPQQPQPIVPVPEQPQPPVVPPATEPPPVETPTEAPTTEEPPPVETPTEAPTTEEPPPATTEDPPPTTPETTP